MLHEKIFFGIPEKKVFLSCYSFYLGVRYVINKEGPIMYLSRTKPSRTVLNAVIEQYKFQHTRINTFVVIITQNYFENSVKDILLLLY